MHKLMMVMPVIILVTPALRYAAATSTIGSAAALQGTSTGLSIGEVMIQHAQQFNVATTTSVTSLPPIKRQAPGVHFNLDAPEPHLDPYTTYSPYNDGYGCPEDYYSNGRYCQDAGAGARYELRCWLDPNAYDRYPVSQRNIIYRFTCAHHHVCKTHDGATEEHSIDCVSRYETSRVRSHMRKTLPDGVQVQYDRSGAVGGSSAGSSSSSGPSLETASWHDVYHNSRSKWWRR